MKLVLLNMVRLYSNRKSMKIEWGKFLRSGRHKDLGLRCINQLMLESLKTYRNLEILSVRASKSISDIYKDQC